MSDPTIGFIFARGGSKGVPRKNLRMLGGKPLIAHAIEAACNCKSIDRVVVSTEDEEIARVAEEFGAEIPFMRPMDLARDDSPEWLAWQHAIRTFEQTCAKRVGTFVSIPATSPLRGVEDVEHCIQTFKNGDADVVFTVRPSDRNPYFNMVVLDDQKHARLVIPPQGKVFRRQDAPRVYDITTVAYVARPEFILTSNGIFEGRVLAVEVPSERAVDIDTELDFQFAEFLMSRRTNPTHP